MKKLFALLILWFCHLYTYAQRSDHTDNDFKACGVGLHTGFANTVSSELLGPSYIYNTANIGGSFSIRPLRHMQIGLSIDHSIAAASSIWSTAISMTFPIGRGRSYFYPGWHFIYVTADNQSPIGIGVILGGNIALNDWLALNVQSDGSVLLFGSRLSFSTGLIATL